MTSSRTLISYLALFTLLVACGGSNEEPAHTQSSGHATADAASPTKRRDAGTSGAQSGSKSTDDTGDDGEHTSKSGADAGAGTSAAGSLPCDVQAVLAEHCGNCHGSEVKYGAPFSLVTLADLLAPVKDQDNKKRIEVLLERVQDDAKPMPPAPAARLSKDEISTLKEWLSAGTKGSSDSCEGKGDAGARGDTTLHVGDLPKPDDCEETFELKAHGGTSATDASKFKTASTPALQGNQYQCFYFDPPYGSDAGMYWFESILDNVANLHHWILYATDNKTHESGTTAGCNASEPNAYFVAGWAPGANNGAATPDVALDLPSGPKAGLILEVHYYNNTGSPVEDASGIRFCTGKKSGRPHLAAVHSLGSEGICIQPGASQDVTGTCEPRTDMGDVHITGVWPHMHKTARHMKVSIKRKDGSTEVIHDKPFDFNSQIFYPLKDVVLHSGDKVETTCSYKNDGTTQVHFGERTQDEMCYAFTAAWPAGALTNAPSPLGGGTSTESGNRCADPLSILNSCNGISDRPVDAMN